MLCLNPDQTFPVTVDHDADRPTKPAIIVKALTCREAQVHRQHLAAAVKAEDAGDLDTMLTKLADAIAVGFRGAENLPTVKTALDLLDVVTTAELWEIAAKVPTASALSKEELGKSALASGSSGVNTPARGTESQAHAESAPQPPAPSLPAPARPAGGTGQSN